MLSRESKVEKAKKFAKEALAKQVKISLKFEIEEVSLITFLAFSYRKNFRYEIEMNEKSIYFPEKSHSHEILFGLQKITCIIEHHESEDLLKVEHVL